MRIQLDQLNEHYIAREYNGEWFSFERSFNMVPTTMLLRTYYWPTVVIITVTYLMCIITGQRYMRDHAPFQLRLWLFIWNASLALFSALGAWRHTAELWFVYRTDGFMGTVCTVSLAHSMVAFWAEKFAASKVIELGDTAFLVLRKRPVSFLHWYHHVTVLAYTWHAVSEHAVAGRWFIWMNYTVHSVMYTYYAYMSLGWSRLPRFLSASITTLQITQMFLGCFVSLYVYSVKKANGHCHQSWENLYYCFVMYATYMLLFIRYFYMAYLHTPKYKHIEHKHNGHVQNGVKNGFHKNGYHKINGKLD